MRYLFLSIIHAMKIGTVICMILACIMLSSYRPLESSGTFANILFICAMVAIIKFICGGWTSSTLKGMVWSVILSTIGSLALCIGGMKAGGHSISFLMVLLPLIIGLIGGIASYKWVEDVIDNDTYSSISGDDIVESVFDNGLKDTFNAFASIAEDNFYYSISRGVAVYSNLAIIISLVMYFIYI